MKLSLETKRLREVYDKKRSEGKLFKLAVIACANKLLQCCPIKEQNHFPIYSIVTKPIKTMKNLLTKDTGRLFGMHIFSIT